MKATTVRQHTRRKPDRPSDPFAAQIAKGVEARKRKASAHEIEHIKLTIEEATYQTPRRSPNETALARAIQNFRNFVDGLKVK